MYESDHYVFYIEDILENNEMSVHTFYHDDSFIFNKEKRYFNEHICHLVNYLIEEDND